MDKVTTLHQHKVLVVAPSVGLPVTFPFGIAFSFFLSKDMKVCHSEVEGTIRTAKDVWVAYTALFGNGVAVDDGLVLVEGMEGVAVLRDGHVDGVGVVLMVNHEITTHPLTFRREGA